MKARPDSPFFSVFSATLLLISVFFLAPLLSSRAFSEEIDCRECHSRFLKGATHKALEKGCRFCHTGIDASASPHKISNNVEKGLFSGQPDLCFRCHNKSPFTHKTAHPALDMGCTSCHNPHTSKNPRLLKSALPDLCYGCHDDSMFTKIIVHPALDQGCTACHNPHSAANQKLLVAPVPELCFKCHDKAAFSKKNVHYPVAGGMCLYCHGPHSSDTRALLNKGPDVLCLECHAQMATKRHGADADSAAKSENAKDSTKSCLGCHAPHSSDSKKLLRSSPAR